MRKYGTAKVSIFKAGFWKALSGQLSVQTVDLDSKLPWKEEEKRLVKFMEAQDVYNDSIMHFVKKYFFYNHIL